MAARWHKRNLLLVLLVGLILIVFGGQIQRVSAHANLVRSEPRANAVLDTAPTEVKLWFSETPEPRFSEVKLYDRAGQEINGLGALHGDAQDDKLLIVTLPALSPGIYTVAWRALSAADGHTTAGAFAFVIGRDQVPAEGLRPTSPAADSASGPTIPTVTIRWLNYLSLALLTGGFAFVPLVYQHALKSASRKKSGAVTPPGSFSHASRLFTVLVISWGVAVLAMLAGAVLQTATSARVDSLAALGTPLITLLTTTRYGTLFWLRVLLLIGIGGLLAFRQSRWWQNNMALRWWWIGFALSLFTLLTVSLGSHAAAIDPILAVLRDWLHLSTVSTWIGGLAALLLTLLWLRRDNSVPSAQTMAYVVNRFSQVATICIGLIVLSGLYRVLDEIGDLFNLLDTPYGMTLLLKLGLLIPLLLLGIANLLVIQRRLMQTAHMPESETSIRPWYRLIRQTVGGEIVFAAAILLVTGALTSLPPGRDAFGSGILARGQAGDLRIILNANPGQLGQNTFNIYLRDSMGRPVNGAQKVALIFTMVEHDMGTSEAAAASTGEGRYTAQSSDLSMAGIWRAEVLVRRAGRDDARTTLTLPVRASARRSASSAGYAPVLVDPSRALIGAIMAIVGLLSLTWVRRLNRARHGVGWIVMIAGILIAGVGTGITANAFVNEASLSLPTQNPIPADKASRDRGQLVYAANCAVCHGSEGRGDGPAAASLNPKPANLRVHLAQGHSDGQLFEWISQGIDGTAMPAFEGRLTEPERWDVINYIKTFAAAP